jgi:hypothetical protein
VLEAGFGGFDGWEAGEVLVDAGGGEESPHAVGDADESDLAAFTGLRDVEIDNDAEAGGVHVFERGTVEDEKVGVDGLQLRLELEDMAQGEGSVQGKDGAAWIRCGVKGVVEAILRHPLRIETPAQAKVNIR